MNGWINVVWSQQKGDVGCCYFLKIGVFFILFVSFLVWFCDGAIVDWLKDDLGEEQSGDSRGMVMFYVVMDVIFIFKDGSCFCSLLDGCLFLMFELFVFVIVEVIWKDICEYCWDKSFVLGRLVLVCDVLCEVNIQEKVGYDMLIIYMVGIWLKI